VLSTPKIATNMVFNVDKLRTFPPATKPSPYNTQHRVV
jgi:hypothetical protein